MVLNYVYNDFCFYDKDKLTQFKPFFLFSPATKLPKDCLNVCQKFYKEMEVTIAISDAKGIAEHKKIINAYARTMTKTDLLNNLILSMRRFFNNYYFDALASGKSISSNEENAFALSFKEAGYPFGVILSLGDQKLRKQCVYFYFIAFFKLDDAPNFGALHRNFLLELFLRKSLDKNNNLIQRFITDFIEAYRISYRLKENQFLNLEIDLLGHVHLVEMLSDLIQQKGNNTKPGVENQTDYSCSIEPNSNGFHPALEQLYQNVVELIVQSPGNRSSANPYTYLDVEQQEDTGQFTIVPHKINNTLFNHEIILRMTKAILAIYHDAEDQQKICLRKIISLSMPKKTQLPNNLFSTMAESRNPILLSDTYVAEILSLLRSASANLNVPAIASNYKRT